MAKTTVWLRLSLLIVLGFSGNSVADETTPPVNGGTPPPAVGCVADTLKADLKVYTTEEEQQEFARIAHSLYWGKWIDDDADYRRLIDPDTFKRKKASVYPTEMYGIGNFMAWRKAADYLDNIPKGKLELSLDLFSKVHEKASDGLNPILKKLSPIIPDGYVPSKGGIYKKRQSFGRDPLFHPLTEVQYEAVKSNPWLDRFVELPSPMSKPGARRGILLYPNPKDAIAKLEKLIDWYNQNKETMDPVDLAANFQRAFVSIHPFVDGNGRTSRLLMDRILAEHGLPPPVFNASPDNDVYMKPEEYAKLVRASVQNYIDMETEALASGKNGMVTGAPAPAPVGAGEWTPQTTWLGTRSKSEMWARPGKIKKPKHMSTRGWGEEEVLLGGRPFTFAPDGFFYSNKGIPYALHGDTLYPISDQSYWLYFNHVEDQADRVTDSQKKIYRSHFRLLHDIDQGIVDQNALKLGSYDEIAQANHTNKVHLYDWQKDAFLDAVTITATDPSTVLANGRSWRNEIKPTDVSSGIIGKYELMDLKFSKYQDFAEKNYPEAVPVILESRKKLHAAARSLFQDFLKERDTLSAQDRKVIETLPGYRLFNDYLSHSKLSYESFDEAMKKTNDQFIYLLRADSNAARFIGFRSQDDYKRIFDKLPESKKIKAFLLEFENYLGKDENKKKIEEKVKEIFAGADTHQGLINLLPKNLRDRAEHVDATYGMVTMILNKLNSNIVGSKYQFRGTSEEFERSYVDYVLHAQGDTGDKVGTSFTTAPRLLTPSSARADGALIYTSSIGNSSVFLVRTPKAKVEHNSTTSIVWEYEVLGVRPIQPWEIKARYSGQELTQPLSDDVTPAVKEFLEKYHLGGHLTAKEIKDELEKHVEEYEKLGDAMEPLPKSGGTDLLTPTPPEMPPSPPATK